jgi:universal stress protein A
MENPSPTFRSDPAQEKAPHNHRHTIPNLHLKRILVPIDFSECSVRALDYALAFAEQFAAKIILLHVVEPAVYPENYLAAPATLQEVQENLVQVGREHLAELSRKRLGHRIEAELLVRIGRAHSEIPDTAKAMGADLIVIGTHGHTGLKHVLLGSTAERVVRYAACPVLTVRYPDHGAID